MNDNELADIEQKAAKATPGPWTVHTNDGWPEIHGDKDKLCEVEFGRHNDASFIVAAREAVPKLCAEVRRLRAKLDCAGKSLGDMSAY